ncbi:MAG TPA: MFS transporter [Trueperaceae bacterium]|nr:MFS transporter [Trueperaceae bacterium]
MSRRLVPRLLQDSADFRRLFSGETISLFGDQVSLLAVPLVAVLALHAGPAQMGYLSAAMLAPNLLLALHLGALIDRRGRRRQAMIAADIGRALLLATVPAAYALGVLSFVQLLVVGFLVGTLSVVFHVSYATLFTAIVPRERYVEANQLLHGSRAFSFVTGPSVGGALVQALTAPVAVLADALSFLGSAFFLRRIRAAEPPGETAARGQLLEGLRFIRRTPLLLAMLASTATINLFNFGFWALYVLFVTETLGVTPSTLGLIVGAAAVGGVLGALFTGRIGKRIGIGPTFVLGSFLFPAPLLLVPMAGGPRPAVLAMLFVAEFVSGIGLMLLDINSGSIQQALIPDRMRARVAGSYMTVNYGVRPLGSLLGGTLGAWIGLRPALLLVVAGSVLGVLFLLPSPAVRLRGLPDPAE